VLFIPSCPGLTGLTGVRDRSDRCRPLNCLTRVSLGRGATGQFLVCLELFCQALCRVSFRAGCVLGVFLVQGLEKSLRLSGTLVVQLL
jgi:hypothetical protein